MNPKQDARGRWHGPVAAWLATALFAGCEARDVASPPARAATSAVVARQVDGYLAPAARPDSAALLPPPAAAGSPELALDEAEYRRLLSLARTPRWEIAGEDGNLQLPAALDAYSCALGLTAAQAHLPRLHVLLQRTVVDAGQSTAAAKQKYQRQRPFEVAGDEICVPADLAQLRGSASYPSGHASIGYVWGEVLAAVAPARADAVRERGLQFGISRAVCRLHWQSDIDAGRKVGASVMLALRDTPEFVADLDAARREFAQAASMLGPPPERDCAAEAVALALTRP